MMALRSKREVLAYSSLRDFVALASVGAMRFARAGGGIRFPVATPQGASLQCGGSG